MAQFLKNDLRMRGIEYDAPEIDAGGPWGYRHQINIADSGFGESRQYVVTPQL